MLFFDSQLIVVFAWQKGRDRPKTFWSPHYWKGIAS